MIKLSRKAATVKAAVVGFLTPRLAQDAKVDLSPLFEGVNSSNYVKSKPAIALGVARATAGKLAKDAKLEDLDRVLMAFDVAEPEDLEDEKKADKANDKSAGDRRRGRDAMPEAFMKHMEKKMSADDFKGMCDSMEDYEAEDEDESEEERKKREDEEAKDKKARDKATRDDAQEDDDKKEKAMDAKITAAVAGGVKAERQRQEGKQEALAFVRPFVGDLDALAFDSAETVFRKALQMRGVSVDAVKEVAALRAILEAQPKPGAQPRIGANMVIATDATSVDFLHKLAPGLANIRIGA